MRPARTSTSETLPHPVLVISSTPITKITTDLHFESSLRCHNISQSDVHLAHCSYFSSALISVLLPTSKANDLSEHKNDLSEHKNDLSERNGRSPP